MSAIRLTAKRQATLPRALCEEMGLRPGDTLLVTRTNLKGQATWCFQPAGKSRPGWFGSLCRYARGKPHDMAAVRRSIAEARRRGRL
jgi:bifunctional DNA-binding transcriptional regulator/antitoxin component of YhaV-PrlF toxin-antitoxin module